MNNKYDILRCRLNVTVEHDITNKFHVLTLFIFSVTPQLDNLTIF